MPGGLSRCFVTKIGVVAAVRGVGLRVPQGSIVGLLGPSGAGKSTTMRKQSGRSWNDAPPALVCEERHREVAPGALNRLVDRSIITAAARRSERPVGHGSALLCDTHARAERHRYHQEECVMSPDVMIEIRDLEVRYPTAYAVRGISLSIGRGEIFGLLGPNGAGKTTTLACIEGLRAPTAGSVRVAGFELPRQAARVKRLLGVQLQKTALFDSLSALELVRLYAALYDCYPSRAEAIALLDRFNLDDRVGARAGQLSGGQQQRLALALALVNDPQVVLLDEPGAALDPQSRRAVWALIREMQGEGRTVLLTTHSMEEAQELCDRVGIVDGGRLVALGAPGELIQRYAPPLPPAEAARRQPNLEDVFLALTGRGLAVTSEEL